MVSIEQSTVERDGYDVSFECPLCSSVVEDTVLSGVEGDMVQCDSCSFSIQVNGAADKRAVAESIREVTDEWRRLEELDDSLGDSKWVDGLRMDVVDALSWISNIVLSVVFGGLFGVGLVYLSRYLLTNVEGLAFQAGLMIIGVLIFAFGFQWVVRKGSELISSVVGTYELYGRLVSWRTGIEKDDVVNYLKNREMMKQVRMGIGR